MFYRDSKIVEATWEELMSGKFSPKLTKADLAKIQELNEITCNWNVSLTQEKLYNGDTSIEASKALQEKLLFYLEEHYIKDLVFQLRRESWDFEDIDQVLKNIENVTHKVIKLRKRVEGKCSDDF